MRRFILLITIIMAALNIAACGQEGALYLPGHEPKHQTTS